LQAWLYKGVRPHARHEEVLTELARSTLRQGSENGGIAIPSDVRVVLHKFISVDLLK